MKDNSPLFYLARRGRRVFGDELLHKNQSKQKKCALNRLDLRFEERNERQKCLLVAFKMLETNRMTQAVACTDLYNNPTTWPLRGFFSIPKLGEQATSPVISLWERIWKRRSICSTGQSDAMTGSNFRPLPFPSLAVWQTLLSMPCQQRNLTCFAVG